MAQKAAPTIEESLEEVVRALAAACEGDFSVRLPARRRDVVGELQELGDLVVGQLQHLDQLVVRQTFAVVQDLRAGALEDVSHPAKIPPPRASVLPGSVTGQWAPTAPGPAAA